MSHTSSRLSDWLLGTDPRMRDRTFLCLLAALVYLCWAVLMLTFTIPKGRMSAELGPVFLTLMFPAIFVTYPLVRMGATRHLKDPGLVAPQILWGGMIASLGYATVPTARAPLLLSLGLILVFGFINLSSRVVVFIGAALIGMLMCVLLVGTFTPLPQFNPASQTVKVLTAAFILGLITVQSRKFAKLRERVAIERRQLAAAQRELERVTHHDGLTGLFSRPYLHSLLEQEHRRALLSGRSFGVILIDLDHFKAINDQHGHQVGDAVLMAFGRVAREALRETDWIGRWGGEEFLVLLPDADAKTQAQQIIERLRLALTQTTAVETLPDLHITFSAGYAFWQSQERIEHLLERADRALYAAKRAGRNCAVAAQTELDPA